MARFTTVVIALALGLAAGMALQSPSDLLALAGPYCADAYAVVGPVLAEMWEGLRSGLSCAAVITLPLVTNAIAMLQRYHAFVQEYVRCPS